MASVDLAPKGSVFTRMAICRGLAPDDVYQQHKIACQRWGSTSKIAMIMRDAVGGGSASDPDYDALAGTRFAEAEFVDFVRPLTLVGKLQGLRRIPANVRVCTVTDGTTAFWVGEAMARPISRLALEGTALKPRTAAAMTVVSQELISSADVFAEAQFRMDLAAAAAELVDVAFIHPDADGTVGPESITHGLATIPGTGDLAADLGAAVAAFGGNLLTASWIMAPALAVRIALRSQLGADLNVRGGSLLGLPAVTSQSVPDGLLVLADAGGIQHVDEGIELRISASADIEMSDAPTGDSQAPTASTGSVNMFQTGSVAYLLSRQVNWRTLRPDGVVLVDLSETSSGV